MTLSRRSSKLPPWLDQLELNQRLKRKIKIVGERYYDEETRYGAYVCIDDESRRPFHIFGEFPSPLQAEQWYIIEGKVTLYKHEKQIKVESLSVEMPTTPEGVMLILQSLKGLNKRAQLLFDLYGMEILSILRQNPQRIAAEVAGIGPKLVDSWSQQIKLLQGNEDALARMVKWGLSLQQAKRLMQELGHDAEERILLNPYLLIRKVKGFGFKRCDEIAKEIGFYMKGKQRMAAAVRYVLREAAQEGHCFLMRDELVFRIKKTLDIYLSLSEVRQLLEKHKGTLSFTYKIGAHSCVISYDQLYLQVQQHISENRSSNQSSNFRYSLLQFSIEEIENHIQMLLDKRKLVQEKGRMYLADTYRAEWIIAVKILKLLLYPVQSFEKVEEDIDSYLKEQHLQLEQKQREAVSSFCENSGGMYILNGSAGCGKTFTLKVILAVLEKQYDKLQLPFRVKIFAPTGKAAKVASKATERECTTIHRGLRFNAEGRFQYGEENPLDVDCLVIDESSMLDIHLAKHLFQAIPPSCKVILMGDTKQLPSIGAGNVLHDFIQSEVIPVVTLNVVKRQTEHSGILINANRIIEGQMITSNDSTSDAYVIQHENTEGVQRALLKSIERLMESRQYSLKDIQVLCPQRKGEVGTYVLNWLIQQRFNGSKAELQIENRKFIKQNIKDGTEEEVTLYFKPGDKVIHTSNNYGMKWYEKGEHGSSYEEIRNMTGITNGECGVIEEIYIDSTELEGDNQIIVVRYDDGYVLYESPFDELDHCYAMTIHKSQGSQWAAVLMTIMMENNHMLDNSIFYTGYTRAKDFNCVIGQQKAIQYAITTFKTHRRNTSLNERFTVQENVNEYEEHEVTKET